jgi:hypothetical protein
VEELSREKDQGDLHGDCDKLARACFWLRESEVPGLAQAAMEVFETVGTARLERPGDGAAHSIANELRDHFLEACGLVLNPGLEQRTREEGWSTHVRAYYPTQVAELVGALSSQQGQQAMLDQVLPDHTQVALLLTGQTTGPPFALNASLTAVRDGIFEILSLLGPGVLLLGHELSVQGSRRSSGMRHESAKESGTDSESDVNGDASQHSGRPWLLADLLCCEAELLFWSRAAERGVPSSSSSYASVRVSVALQRMPVAAQVMYGLQEGVLTATLVATALQTLLAIACDSRRPTAILALDFLLSVRGSSAIAAFPANTLTRFMDSVVTALEDTGDTNTRACLLATLETLLHAELVPAVDRVRLQSYLCEHIRRQLSKGVPDAGAVLALGAVVEAGKDAGEGAWRPDGEMVSLEGDIGAAVLTKSKSSSSSSSDEDISLLAGHARLGCVLYASSILPGAVPSEALVLSLYSTAAAAFDPSGAAFTNNASTNARCPEHLPYLLHPVRLLFALLALPAKKMQRCVEGERLAMSAVLRWLLSDGVGKVM